MAPRGPPHVISLVPFPSPGRSGQFAPDTGPVIAPTGVAALRRSRRCGCGRDVWQADGGHVAAYVPTRAPGPWASGGSARSVRACP